VVATSVGGLPEAVEDGRTGLVVEPGDAGALAKAVVSLLADPDMARAMGKAGRRKLERESASPIVAEQTFSVYRLAAHQAAIRASSA
jgi:glycosyltransferase involved in cell wall biosynthesis